MKINKIYKVNTASNYTKNIVQNGSSVNGQSSSNSHVLYNQLNTIAYVNKYMATLNFKGSSVSDNKNFNINLSINELEKRTSPSHFAKYTLIDENNAAYKNLSNGDKTALKHLVKAARILDEVYLIQDNPHNMAVKNYLEEQSLKDNKAARLALELFNAQKGINAKDIEGESVNIVQGIESKPQCGFYPEDLKEDEFHNILISMIQKNKISEVKKILNQRTMVERDGEELKAIDYTDYFKNQFLNAATELELAALSSSNDDFNRYLILQANALLGNNPYMDALADKKWAKLQHTPLEFTISRESYDDKMTPSVNKNKKLSSMLKKYGITPYAKDTIGVRVGIVNKKGTDYLLKIKEYMPLMADNMPFKDEYEQNITQKDNKQTMVDVDMVDVTGQKGAYRGGISLASNLPNNDKLSVMTGGGKRNVYHIQMRESKYADNIAKKLDAVLDKSQHKYFDTQALHDFTILHENVHSLGPKNGTEKLGIYKNTIEENKADMGAIVMLDVLTKKGFYTPEQQKKILVSYFSAYVQKGPDFSNAHRLRNIMQNNFFIKEGAVSVNDEGIMTVNFEKVTPAANKMLEKIIRLQLDGTEKDANEYIKENALWSEELDRIAHNIKQADSTLNARVVAPLADKLAVS
ncbi:MAG: hypothetical protein KHX03_01465 [Clostridium sp.]|nr:hypothetical protein [Clostridium sp.]